ncbi:MAG: hypothetical protein E7648_04045 [Ruminococcaceae bacterium]|nr:hypothetical protein [Oscillospiraceae bacterium]
MLEAVLREAEKYSFPIIITDGKSVTRNSEAKRIRSLSRVLPMSCLTKKTKENLLLMSENSAVAVKTKRGPSLVYRIFDYLIFMYLPMLENIGNIPNDIFDLNVSGNDLPEALSNLSQKLFPKGEITASSFFRVASLSATLAFSEDTVKGEIDGDGMIEAKEAFSALGRAIEDLDIKMTELREPPITVAFSDGEASVSLYGEKIWSASSVVLTAVSPYSFTEKEYSAAFAAATVISIFKSRK